MIFIKFGAQQRLLGQRIRSLQVSLVKFINLPERISHDPAFHPTQYLPVSNSTNVIMLSYRMRERVDAEARCTMGKNHGDSRDKLLAVVMDS